MSPHSWLFVPGHSERKLSKSGDVAANALILDLEDGVPPEYKPAARVLVREFLLARRSCVHAQLWVRINAQNTRDSFLDLAAIVPAVPYGLMVPKVDHASELIGLSENLNAFEAQAGIAVGTTRIIPLLETPSSILNAPEYLRSRVERVAGITWGAEDLGATLGVRSSRDATGDWTLALRSARVQCLLVAKALQVNAIDTVTTDFHDLESLQAECLVSRAAGFTAKLAIHPDQVTVINSAFLPSVIDIERARRVVGAFEAAPGCGAVAVDGSMVDLVHLRAARDLLGQEDF